MTIFKSLKIYNINFSSTTLEISPYKTITKYNKRKTRIANMLLLNI